MSIDQSSRRASGRGFDTRSLVIGVAAIAVLTAIAAAVLWWAWDDLPDRIATHWNGAGKPDGFTARGTGLVLMLLALPSAISIGLAVVVGFVPRSAPGTRWISALPVGLVAALLISAIGATVQQRNGGDATIGLLMLAMLAGGVAAAAAIVPLLPRDQIAPLADAPPADAVRLAESSEAWWTGNARTKPLASGALAALCVLPGIVIAAATGIAWFIVVILVVPAVLVFANARFRVTVGRHQFVASGALLGWPKLTVPLDTIASAETRTVSIWKYGGLGVRYRPSGTGVITRSGEALVLVRGDGTEIAVTVDDATTAAATINTLRTRATA